MREALAISAEEGLKEQWERHENMHHLLWDGLKSMGLKSFVQNDDERLITVNTITVCLSAACKCAYVGMIALRAAAYVPPALGGFQANGTMMSASSQSTPSQYVSQLAAASCDCDAAQRICTTCCEMTSSPWTSSLLCRMTISASSQSAPSQYVCSCL